MSCSCDLAWQHNEACKRVGHSSIGNFFGISRAAAAGCCYFSRSCCTRISSFLFIPLQAGYMIAQSHHANTWLLLFVLIWMEWQPFRPRPYFSSKTVCRMDLISSSTRPLPDFCVDAIQVGLQDDQQFTISANFLACIVHLLDCFLVKAVQLLLNEVKSLQAAQSFRRLMLRCVDFKTVSKQPKRLKINGHLHTSLHVHDFRKLLIVHKVVYGIHSTVSCFDDVQASFQGPVFSHSACSSGAGISFSSKLALDSIRRNTVRLHLS